MSCAVTADCKYTTVAGHGCIKCQFRRSLSDLRGKVIVLDFSAIEMEQSKGYIFELRELYNRYQSRGMAIYSVSLDRNKLLWEVEKTLL